ncbi:Inorganic pyrophosphatase/Nucleosome remodeling factor, subunit NURF38, partial [Pseudoloma neurophilia]
MMITKYNILTTGSKYAESFRVYITENGRIISPFHDIPLYNNELHVNVVNEIPRFENAKFEINKSHPRNPIIQDIKNGKTRFVANVFPAKGFPWNYGALPQTWEDPNVKDEKMGCAGDNDPLDVIDISTIAKKIGEVYAAKVIGCIGMIDDNECDWKVIVIDLRDEMCKSINDIDDLKTQTPTLHQYMYQWLRDYKIPDGKPANTFLDGGELKNKKFTMKIINECHQSWKKLMDDETIKDISRLTKKTPQTDEETGFFTAGTKPDAALPQHVLTGV